MTRDAFEQLSDYLSGQGLRATLQRDRILREFLAVQGHVSAEELYLRLKKSAPSIGYATVYRTLKLLATAGLADERHFDDGITRYEYAPAGDHHDHLICTACGKIIEFENRRIEQLQQDVARKHGFLVRNHKLELYGMCVTCRKKTKRPATSS